MKVVPAIRRALLPSAVFLAVVLLHYLWLGAFPERNAAQSRWETVGAKPNTSWFNRYIESQSYWMGYSYALPLAFAAVALRRYRECREQRACAARNVAMGGVTLSGVVAAAACFLTGCCGSPMLGVYLSSFGAAFLPLVKPLIAGITTAMVALSYYWWIWRRSRTEIASPCPTACASDKDCDCNAPAKGHFNQATPGRADLRI